MAAWITQFHAAMDPLAGLETEYQILTELSGSGESRTYLARHLSLNRDVTLTVYRAAGGDRSYLTAFAGDAERLKAQRHPNLVPVIEGRWIDAGSFALARARVRGSTLDQLIDAVGAMPAPRINAALREIASTLAFARANGVTHRFISPASLVFQQGTGRALISFEPSRLVVDDAQTIRELATRMNGGAPFDVAEFVAMLGASQPVVADRQVAIPVGQDDSAVVVRRGGMSFIARVLTTFAVLAVVVVAAVMFWPKRIHETARSGSVVPTDTDGGAAGEVALHAGRVDTTTYPQVYPTPRIVEPPPPPVQQQPVIQPVPQPTPQPIPQPVQQQPAPVRTPPAPIDTAVRSPSGDVCDSPSDADQRECLSAAIQRNDGQLNSVYQRLIGALRRQAGVTDDAPDPPSVDVLRSAQRRWLEERDQACRGVGSGALYARDRAACFADRSAQRVRDLEAQLSAVPE